MKKYLILTIINFSLALSYGQESTKISTLDFVQVLNNNTPEVEYYYKNNWKVLRENAVERGYIHSYKVFDTKYTVEAPFHYVLITTYENKEQYDLREENFAELIEEKGDLKLLNDKKPKEFRKVVFSKEFVSQWHD